jgi:signal transduction histidine kinase
VLSNDGLVERVLEHIAEISAGKCSITDGRITAEGDASVQQILAGLLMLHEDLQYSQQRQAALLDELRLAVRVRDEFLSVASHELRTPLTTLGLQIDGLSRALPELVSGPQTEKVARRLELTRRQVDRLTALVATLVDVSRITAGKLQLTKQHADLVDIVQTVAERLGDDAQRSGSSLGIEAGGPVWGNFDVSRVDQVLTNLVSNAIRYGRGQQITIVVDGKNANARFCVEDRGIGIAPEHQARVFQQFERAAPSTSYGGLGLGLWISAQIVDAMGGTISVRSKVDVGSVFTVELPRGS